jgi:hypothetical protein
MCQIVSGNQGSDVDDLPITSLPTRRLPRRPNFVIGSSKDIRLCPVMNKISFPPGGSRPAASGADSFQPAPPPPLPVQFPTTSSEDEEHSCVICSQFIKEEASTGKQEPQNGKRRSHAGKRFQVCHRFDQLIVRF